jgi:hypothetical protein
MAVYTYATLSAYYGSDPIMKVSEIRLELLVHDVYGNKRFHDAFTIRINGTALRLVTVPSHIIETLWFDHQFDPGPTKEIHPHRMTPAKLEEALSLVWVKFFLEGRKPSRGADLATGTTIELSVKKDAKLCRIYKGTISKIDYHVVVGTRASRAV